MAACGELTLTSFVLRHKLPAKAHETFAAFVADFLVPDISLARACEVAHAGSTALLDLVWTRSLRRTKFCVATLLQRDKIYSRWEFSRAMTRAVRRSDKAMLRWLLNHFPGCPVGENVVVEAAKCGHLWILQLLEADKSHGGIQWNDKSLGEASKQGHWEIVEWLDQRTGTPQSRRSNYGVMDGAIGANDLERVKWVIAKGFGVIDFGESSEFPETNWAARKEVLWYLLDRGYGDSALIVEGALSQAARVGDLELLETLLERNEDFNYPEEVYEEIWDAVRKKGHVPLIQWLVTHPAYFPEAEAPYEAMLWAAAEGRLDMIIWLLEQEFQDVNSERVRLFERSRECYTDHTSNAVVMAATNGHLRVVQIFHSLIESTRKNTGRTKRHCRRAGAPDWSFAVMNAAAANGHLDIVKWLHAHRWEGCTVNAMDDAAANGHLDVVKWLHVHRSEGCTAAAMDRAAANGHLDVVKWLHTNRKEGCTTAAMDMTAARSEQDATSFRSDKCSKSFTTIQTDMLEWLHANRSEGCTTDAMDGAAAANNIEVLEWLHNHLNAGCTKNAMDLAACRGHLDAVKWLHSHRTEGCTDKALETAACYGYLKVVRWLLANRDEVCPAAPIDSDLSCGRFSVVQILAPHWSQAELRRAIRSAILSGQFEIMIYLHEQRNDKPSNDEKKELWSDDAILERWQNEERLSYLGSSYPGEIRVWLEENYQVSRKVD